VYRVILILSRFIYKYMPDYYGGALVQSQKCVCVCVETTSEDPWMLSGRDIQNNKM